MLEGDRRGTIGFIDPQYLQSVIPEPKSPPKIKVANVPSPAKADRDLNIAKNLDKSGKIDAAVAAYRAVVKNYPDSPQAARAASRLKTLSDR